MKFADLPLDGAMAHRNCCLSFKLSLSFAFIQLPSFQKFILTFPCTRTALFGHWVQGKKAQVDYKPTWRKLHFLWLLSWHH